MATTTRRRGQQSGVTTTIALSGSGAAAPLNEQNASRSASAMHYVDAVNDFETFLNSTLSSDLSSEIGNIMVNCVAGTHELNQALQHAHCSSATTLYSSHSRSSNNKSNTTSKNNSKSTKNDNITTTSIHSGSSASIPYAHNLSSNQHDADHLKQSMSTSIRGRYRSDEDALLLRQNLAESNVNITSPCPIVPTSSLGIWVLSLFRIL
jgi:hypothetical protein